MGKLEEIIEGWAAYFELGKQSVGEEVLLRRVRECVGCKWIGKSAVLSWLLPDGELKQVQGYRCRVCRCPLSAKVRSEIAKCPHGKW